MLCGGFSNVFCQVNELKRLRYQLDSTSECSAEGGTMWLEVRECVHRGEVEKKGSYPDRRKLSTSAVARAFTLSRC